MVRKGTRIDYVQASRVTMPWLSSRGPAVAAWLLGALTALALAGSVYRVPIQVSDSLEVIQRVVPMSSAASAFVAGLHNSGTMLRPLKEVRTKLLVQAGETLGGRYHLVFRGYHVLAGAILVGLFVWVCRARTWTDVAALACGQPARRSSLRELRRRRQNAVVEVRFCNSLVQTRFSDRSVRQRSVLLSVRYPLNCLFGINSSVA